jgi:hypothetical protein
MTANFVKIDHYLRTSTLKFQMTVAYVCFKRFPEDKPSNLKCPVAVKGTKNALDGWGSSDSVTRVYEVLMC